MSIVELAVAPPGRAELAHRLERAFQKPMLVAALLVVPVIVIEQAHVGHGLKQIGLVLNWTIWAAFAVEFVVMLAVTPARGAWLRAHPLEAAIVLLTPPFLPASLQALRVFRLLRVLRLTIIVKQFRRVFTLDGIRGAAVIVLVAAFGGGALFAQLEHGHSTWDGVWWAATTMTTVGYGDLSPKTAGGRVLAMALMLIGIGFIALLTGAVAQRFLSTDIEASAVAVEADVAADVASVRIELARELRTMSDRLRELERTIERLV